MPIQEYIKNTICTGNISLNIKGTQIMILYNRVLTKSKNYNPSNKIFNIFRDLNALNNLNTF